MLPWFEWMENLPVSVALRESLWLGPIINALHVVVLVVLIGAVLIVDLRLLGTGLKNLPVARVAKDARPWLIAGILGMVMTGIPQLISTATKEYYSDFFWWKMELLLAALVFTFTVRHMVTMADPARISPVWVKLTGVVSMLLWFGVAIEGRLIGLLS